MGRWYAVADPDALHRRVIMRGSWPSLQYVLARRMSAEKVLVEAPQQSDYARSWQDQGTSLAPRRFGGVKARVPSPVRDLIRAARLLNTGRLAPPDFKPVRLPRVRGSC